MHPPPAGTPAPDLRIVYLDRPREHPPEVPWLWHGYLAAGNVTLLTSLWKAGKTTLVAALLQQMKAGGTRAGPPRAAGKAVVVSEEAPSQWLQRGRKFDL